jgi:hypothetical protein
MWSTIFAWHALTFPVWATRGFAFGQICELDVKWMPFQAYMCGAQQMLVVVLIRSSWENPAKNLGSSSKVGCANPAEPCCTSLHLLETGMYLFWTQGSVLPFYVPCMSHKDPNGSKSSIHGALGIWDDFFYSSEHVVPPIPTDHVFIMLFFQ